MQNAHLLKYNEWWLSHCWLKHLIINFLFPHLLTLKVPGSSMTESSCWSVAALRWPRLLREVCPTFQGWPVLPPEVPMRRPVTENYWTTTTASLHLKAATLVRSHLRETWHTELHIAAVLCLPSIILNECILVVCNQMTEMYLKASQVR